MKPLKIVLLGGGSLYFETVMAEIACTPALDGCEMVLYDINPQRLELMRRVGQRIIAATRIGVRINSTARLVAALDGADFAIASIGVHGPDFKWHRSDSDTAARFGIIHTTGDTVGPGGLSQGLRIIPIFMNIARQMEKYCPHAILLNHSNPMAPICRAIGKYTAINVIGYCHGVAGDVRAFGRLLGIDPAEIQVTVAGPNHCVWLLGITHNNRDLYPRLRRRLRERKNPKDYIFAQEFMDLFEIFPICGDRHLIEFFPHSRLARSTRHIYYGLRWRSDMIKDALVAREISHDPDAIELKAAGKAKVWLPQEGQPSPEAMGHQIKAMVFGPDKVHIVNTPNRGAVTNLPDWAVVELKAVVGAGGAQPVSIGPLPPQAARWSLAQIYAHELTVDAAVEGSRRKALMALACDPMIRDFKEARSVFDALVKKQGERLKKFRA